MKFSMVGAPLLAIILASGLAAPASAAPFLWLNDPNSYPDGRA